MAAPLVQRVTLDSAAALRELAQLERQLAQLNNPINVPVDIDVDGTNRAENQMRQLRGEVDKTGDEFQELERKADQSTDGILRLGTRGASAFTSLRGSIIGIGAAIAAIQGVRLLGGFAADAIQSASSLQESISKTNVVFGTLSDEVKDFAKTAPQALGLSTAAALESTSTFGNLFVALGLTQQAAADLAPDIVQLAADLTSFNDLAPGEAIEKLRAGLVGEAEPLRVLGVNLTEATVQAKALQLGFVDASGAVTEAGKVQARYALILEQTTTAQGDFARTAGGIANTQRTLSGEFQNAKDVIGEALLPAYGELLKLLPGLIEQFKELAPSFTAVGVALVGAAEDAAPFLSFMLDLARVLPTAVSALAAIPTGDFLAGIRGAQIETTFIEQLRAGVDPAKALANALAQLGRDVDELDADDFAKISAQMIAIANLQPGRLGALSQLLRESGIAAGLSAPEVKELRRQIFLLEQQQFPRRTPGGGADRPDESAAILTESDNLEILGRAADDAGVSIRQLLTDQAALTPELAAAGASLSASTLKYLEQVDAINEVKTAVGLLPGAMDAAQAALRDSEGNIVTDLETFLDNLITTLQDREQFELDLAILRIRGQGALADVFEAEGLDARKALADAVADPTGAGIANATLLGQVRDAGVEISAELEAAVAGQPVTQGLIDNIIAAAAAADSPETKAALLALAASLQLEIPVTFQTPVAGDIPIPSFLLPPTTGSGNTPSSPTRPSSNPFVAVYQTFEQTPDSNTATTRAAAEIAAVVSGVRGV